MLNRAKTASQEAVELLGELHPLMAQLGSADGLVTLSAAASSLRLPRVDSLAALSAFLETYLAQILLPLELPAICRAFHHAHRNEARELIALDRELAGQLLPPELATASRRVGRGQLERLRPLRDERVVQRYLKAAREERACAWHTLVYGLTLALYSLPVRQGLMNYARQTLRGFIQAAARPLRLTKTECQGLLEGLCAGLPRQLEAIVAAGTVSPRLPD
jgi:urease accessory protein UreF